MCIEALFPSLTKYTYFVPDRIHHMRSFQHKQSALVDRYPREGDVAEYGVAFREWASERNARFDLEMDP